MNTLLDQARALLKLDKSATKGPWNVTLARYTPDSEVFGFALEAKGKVPFIASAGVAQPNHSLIVGEKFRHSITTGFTPEEVEANASICAASRTFAVEAAKLFEPGGVIDRAIAALEVSNCECVPGGECSACEALASLRTLKE